MDQHPRRGRFVDYRLRRSEYLQESREQRSVAPVWAHRFLLCWHIRPEGKVGPSSVRDTLVEGDRQSGLGMRDRLWLPPAAIRQEDEGEHECSP